MASKWCLPTTFLILATHEDAERRYTTIRAAAIRAAQSQLPQIAGLELRLIDAAALSAAKKWDADPARFLDWDWQGGYHAFQYRHPKRFELAVWHQESLASLSLGRPTYHGAGLRLDFIEAKPAKPRIQVLPIVLLTMNAYALIIGANELRIMNPINDEVKRYYETFGFSYVDRGDFRFKKV